MLEQANQKEKKTRGNCYLAPRQTMANLFNCIPVDSRDTSLPPPRQLPRQLRGKQGGGGGGGLLKLLPFSQVATGPEPEKRSIKGRKVSCDDGPRYTCPWLLRSRFCHFPQHLGHTGHRHASRRTRDGTHKPPLATIKTTPKNVTSSHIEADANADSNPCCSRFARAVVTRAIRSA